MFKTIAIVATVVVTSVLMAACSGVTHMNDQYPLISAKQAMFDWHNDIRDEEDLPELEINPTLNMIAQSHAEYMAATGDLEHTDGSGDDVEDRATDVGYDWEIISETLARAESASKCRTMMKEDEIAYYRIINPEITEIGIGVAYEGPKQYWCVVYGDR